MANIISRWFGRFTGRRAGQDRRARRNSLRRQLRLEPMESRKLLAADFGAIEGNVYTDLTDDGLDVGDPGILAATVRLYEDSNTNGVFDSGVDTQIATTNTDANGDYLFSGLEAGTYFVEQAPVTGQLQRATETMKTVTITPANAAGIQTLVIDNFETVTTPDPLTANPGTTAEDQQSAPATEIIGMERDVSVVNDSGSGSDISVDIDPAGQIIIDAGVTTTGEVFITYDGVDGSASSIAQNLGGIDLTASNGEALQFRVGSQVGSTLTVEIYSSAAESSSLVLVLPTTAGGAATEDLYFRFADFTIMSGASGEADFSNVTAIRLHANLAAADDIAIDFVGVAGLDITTENFANLNPMSLGDTVFRDPNNNGMLDSGETGIAGVNVSLFEDTNANGVFDTGVDQAVAGGTTTTDANGNYLFENLFPGEYLVVIPVSEFSAGNVLEGFETSTGNDPAPDPNDNVDDDDNGALIAGVGVASQAITLASATEPTDGVDTNNNVNLTLDFGFVPLIDLAVTKSANSAVVSAGNQLTYTINVSNVGQNSATNVVVVDDLPNLAPNNLTVISVTSASATGVISQPGNSDGEIEIAYTSLDPGASDTITIVVEIPDDAEAMSAITNTVTVSAEEGETDTENNSDSIDVAVTRDAVLTLTKSDSPDPSTVGSSLSYEIVVTNTGPSTANNVLVSDNLPSGLTFESVSTTLGTSDEISGLITATIPALAVGQSATITVNTTIQSNFAGTTIPNTTTAVADEAAEVTANANTTINPQIDLAITKSDDVDPNDRGSQLIYTLDIVNNGPSSATNVQVVDSLPADVTFVSASGGTVTPPTVGSQDVIIDLGTLASGATAQIMITVTINSDAAEMVTNTATVSSTEFDAGFDTNTANNTASESTDVNPAIDLSVIKVDSSDPVIAGNDLVYTITVSNDGPSTATGVTMSDTLPAGVTFTSVTSSQGTAEEAGGVVTADLGSLASGASATVTVTVSVDPGTTGTLTNTATATGTETDTNTQNNSDTETTAVNSSVDLVITKTGSIATVSPGNSFSYEIVVTNEGPSTATDVSMTDTLPAELEFVNATSTAGTVNNVGNAITADLGTLAPGASVSITLHTRVLASASDMIQNTATVTSAETDSNSQNNSDNETTEVDSSVDLAITKTGSSASVLPGAALSYEIVVTNNGPSMATSVIMTDTLPAELQFVDAASTMGTVTNDGNAITADLGTLAAGASVTITLNTTVLANATGTIENTATVAAAEAESSTDNNTDSDVAQIVAAALSKRRLLASYVEV